MTPTPGMFNWGKQTITYAKLVKGGTLDAAAKKEIDAVVPELWADAFQVSGVSADRVAVEYAARVLEWVAKFDRPKGRK